MRLSLILANVLSSTALVACGGQTATDVFSTPEDGGVTSNPPKADASTPRTDAGRPPTPPPPVPQPPPPPPKCTTPPQTLKSDSCVEVVFHACGVPDGVNVADGLTPEECDKVCVTAAGKPIQYYWGCAERMTDDLPSPSFDCFTCVEGRRPAGYAEEAAAPRTVGEWLAHAAELERVSIDAFQILARELGAYGAPASLVVAARVAEADEVRHTKMLEAFARREGAKLRAPVIAHGETRSLLAIALENAVEGCVRETYGALVAGYQAAHAERRDIRLAMKSIYRDETAHAQLAWDVHEWISERLTAEELAVSYAAHQADDAGHSVFADLGLPGPRTATAMIAELRSRLFATAFAA